MKHSYPSDRDIIRAIECLDAFTEAACEAQWTCVDDVDVIFLGKNGRMLGPR